MEATQQNILNSNKELVKAIQFQHIFFSCTGDVFYHDKIKQHTQFECIG